MHYSKQRSHFGTGGRTALQDLFAHQSTANMQAGAAMHADAPEAASEQCLRAEIASLHKVIGALIERAERSMSDQGSDFNLFQITLMLEKRVSERTAALEATPAAQRQLSVPSIRH